jgi:hypothetical protein
MQLKQEKDELQRLCAQHGEEKVRLLKALQESTQAIAAMGEECETLNSEKGKYAAELTSADRKLAALEQQLTKVLHQSKSSATSQMEKVQQLEQRVDVVEQNRAKVVEELEEFARMDKVHTRKVELLQRSLISANNQRDMLRKKAEEAVKEAEEAWAHAESVQTAGGHLQTTVATLTVELEAVRAKCEEDEAEKEKLKVQLKGKEEVVLKLIEEKTDMMETSILEDVLLKKSTGKFKRWGKRHCLLTNKKLIWRKEKGGSGEKEKGKGPDGIINLTDVTEPCRAVPEEGEYAFTVPTAHRTYVFQAASKHQLDQWLSLLEEQVHHVADLKWKNGNFKSSGFDETPNTKTANTKIFNDTPKTPKTPFSIMNKTPRSRTFFSRSKTPSGSEGGTPRRKAPRAWNGFDSF